jgi:hypothetical protein
MLVIQVGPYHLELERLPNGLWTGSESKPDGREQFVGALVEDAGVSRQRDWTALKIGERGVRRVMYGRRDGRLDERDPFDPSFRAKGHWMAEHGNLTISVDEWTLEAGLWRQGIYVGVERSTQPDQGFAVVCVRETPRHW